MSNFFTQLSHLLTWPRLCEMEAAGPPSAPNDPKTQSFSGLPSWAPNCRDTLKSPALGRIWDNINDINMPKSPVLDTPPFSRHPLMVLKNVLRRSPGLDIKGHRRTWPVCFSSPILCQPPSWAIFKPMATTSGGIEARCISYHFLFFFLKIPNIP